MPKVSASRTKNVLPGHEPSLLPSYPIESVGNALKLLLMLRDQRAIRVAEASDALGVARSTAHRLFAMLQFYGFVVQDPSSRAYVAGPALVEVGLSVVGEMDVRGRARPYLEALRDEVDETVHLAVLQGTNVLFLDSVEGTRAVRVGGRVGAVMPAHITSLGKALLAELPLDEIRRLYPADRPAPGGSTGKGSMRTHLEAELAQTRARGYASNFGESEDGLSAVGVVIRDRLGRARAAISVSAPVARINRARVVEISDAAMRAAARIGSTLA